MNLFIKLYFLCLTFLPIEIIAQTKDIEKEQKALTIKQYLQLTTNKNKLILAYFHANWCVPCIKLNPIINSIETDTLISCTIVRLDVDENPLISEYLEINTLPLFILYKDGNIVWAVSRMQTKQDILYQIECNK